MIIKPSSLGDVVDGLAVIGPLKRRYPEARIDWVVSEKWRDLLLDVPSIGNLLVFDRDSWRRPVSWPRAAWNFLRLVGAMRKARYDIAIDLQGLLRSAVMAFLSGARIRVGLARAREFSALFYNRRVRVPGGPIHAVDRYLLVARELGADTADVSFPIEVGPGARRKVRAILESKRARRPIVVLNPTARWTTKRWLPDRYAAVGEYVRGTLGGSAVMIGADDEKEVVAKVAAMTKGGAIDLSGKLSLRELTALLAEADALVTNDTGPMHVAAAVGTPVVAIFGPTDPVRTGPYGEGHRVVGTNVCGPCLKRACTKDELECMEGISVGRVTTALEEILSGHAVVHVGDRKQRENKPQRRKDREV